MGHDGSEVRHCGQDGKDTDECVEGCLRADEDAAEDCTGASQSKLRIEWVAPKWGYFSKPVAEWRSVVAGKCPEHSSGSDVRAGNGDDEVEEEYDQQAGCTGFGPASCLEIDGCKGKFGDGAVENVVEGGDGVEDGDVKDERCYEAGGELGNDTFWDVAFGIGNFFGD